ncbi:MAG: hypothetical protein KDJ98_17205 [Rhodobacteraceae bacterium]|nr:hypothetical protein [Paracoccaceae bacterium]
MNPALALQLWQGPLADLHAPATALARAMHEGLAYAPVLDRLQTLALHGLPLAPALPRALADHPWSIDLALIAVRADPGDAHGAGRRAPRCAVGPRPNPSQRQPVVSR